MVKGYDKIDLNYGMLLDLRFREGTGTLTHDQAKPHHRDVDLVGAPTWAQTPLANVTAPVFTAATASEYMELIAADSADLDFTTEDYSIACWIFPIATAQSMMVVAKYALDISGWEIYLYYGTGHEYLTLRHHHVSLAEDRDGCFSDDWTTSAWSLMLITRSGLYPMFYRNGAVTTMSYGVNGMRDPDSAVARDMVIGCRFTKNSDWYNGYMWGLRIWDRELSAIEAWKMFEMERDLFGV